MKETSETRRDVPKKMQNLPIVNNSEIIFRLCEKSVQNPRR